MKKIFCYFRKTLLHVTRKSTDNNLILYLPLLLMGGVFLSVVVFLLGELYSFPAQQLSLSPDDPVQIIDLSSEFFLEGGISPNTADADTLCLLPGVGEKTAQSFIDERNLNGPFILPEDILAVKGIGEKKLEKILSMITLP